jgi:hypothetical protein
MQVEVFLQLVPRPNILYLWPWFCTDFAKSFILWHRHLVVVVRVDGVFGSLHDHRFLHRLVVESHIGPLFHELLLLLHNPFSLRLLHPPVCIQHFLDLGLEIFVLTLNLSDSFLEALSLGCLILSALVEGFAKGQLCES